MKDQDEWGVCNVCKQMVLYGDRFSHPCPDYYVDTSWNAKVNPHNTPGLPGYRFYMEQESGARTGHKSRGFRHVKARTYKVQFEIDRDGHVQHTGAVKPTEELMESARRICERDRPGSNWYPGAEDD